MSVKKPATEKSDADQLLIFWAVLVLSDRRTRWVRAIEDLCHMVMRHAPDVAAEVRRRNSVAFARARADKLTLSKRDRRAVSRELRKEARR
jgi:hypothetical protein